jgi:predicted nucleic acid-binding Zn ribbon protein
MRQSFDAASTEACPRCNGKAKRRFHSVAVIYKGSGFYTTDYSRTNLSASDHKDEQKPPSERAGTKTKAKDTASSTAGDK